MPSMADRHALCEIILRMSAPICSPSVALEGCRNGDQAIESITDAAEADGREENASSRWVDCLHPNGRHPLSICREAAMPDVLHGLDDESMAPGDDGRRF